MSLHKYHYFYKITNLINDKYYYGIHSTNDLNDGYMGSGKALKAAIKKYGVKNFRKDILKFFSSLEELSEFEKFIVNEDLVNDSNCYNLVKGGYFLTDKDLLKLKSSLQGLQSGEKNSAYGTCWITKDGKSMRIHKHELDKYIQNGWIKGRTVIPTSKMIKANSDRVWITKDGQSKFIYKNQLNEYLINGWIKGRVKYKSESEPNQKRQNILNPDEYFITVQDKNGNKLFVSNKDPRYLSGELVSYNKGKVAVEDSDGNKLFISITDPRYLNGELVPIQRKMRGLILVRNKYNEYLWVAKTDPRYINGELIPATTNRKRTVQEKERISLSKTKFKSTWVNNGYTHKYIKLADLDKFLLDNPDWKKGRIKHSPVVKGI